MKAFRSLELGSGGLLFAQPRKASDGLTEEEEEGALQRELSVPTDRRMWAVFRALDRGWSVEELHELTKIDPLVPDAVLAARRAGALGRPRRPARHVGRHAAHAQARRHRRSRARRDSRRRRGGGALVPRRAGPQARLQAHRHLRGGIRVVHAVSLRHLRAGVRGRSRRRAQKVVILGSGPNRIGQGIEFDYCCCHAAFALREEGFETVMVNCNPETVSTDYDTVDRLYFEPLTFEDVFVDHHARAGGRRRRLGRRAVRRPDAAEAGAAAAGGRRQDPRHLAGFDRPRRGSRALREAAVGARHPAGAERHRHVAGGSARGRRDDRLPAGRAAVLRARRPRHGDRLRHGRARPLHDERRRRLAGPSGADRQVPRGRRRARRRRGRRCDRRRRHRRHHGAHRGGRHPLRRQLLRHPAVQGRRRSTSR